MILQFAIVIGLGAITGVGAFIAIKSYGLASRLFGAFICIAATLMALAVVAEANAGGADLHGNFSMLKL